MFDKFYNQSLRKLTVAVGSIFNDVYMRRIDSSGTVISDTRVPLGYGSKAKWMRALREKSRGRPVMMDLPRMSFEMTTATYDPTRKKNTLQKRWVAHTDNAKRYYNYIEVPYDITFDVAIMAQNMEDMLSILEQILPYFTPEFTVSININDVNQNVDVPIVLDSVSMVSEDEGSMEDMRMITADLTFTAKFQVYGPVKESKIINTVTTTFFTVEEFTSTGISGASSALSKVTVGVTGPSGASSGVDTFTDYTTEIRVYGMTGSDGIDIEGENT